MLQSDFDKFTSIFQMHLEFWLLGMKKKKNRKCTDIYNMKANNVK